MRRCEPNARGAGFSPPRRFGGLKPAPHGFSLLEVLAAFVILALVVTALFQLFSSSLNNVAYAEEWSRALELAESRLDQAAAAQPLKEATERGTDFDGRAQWETRVTTYSAPDVDPDLERASEALATRMYRIEVDVKYKFGDGRERTLSLATIKMGPKLTT